MEHDLDHHLSSCHRVIAELGNNLVGIPTETAKLELALLYAVRLGAATNSVRHLSPAVRLRLYQQIAERIAVVFRYFER